ncbi:hypothetical protein GBAR_LOCUS10450 [Geodia barretti]|uniref:Uncharacterized protein n=1 Tax=Geodia barretti TaxID=519541 RepID=A0AA35RSW7_GEOBA|nr:hypothetical protein GBAR_LOCUS10450 [Geodia barretti]
MNPQSWLCPPSTPFSPTLPLITNSPSHLPTLKTPPPQKTFLFWTDLGLPDEISLLISDNRTVLELSGAASAEIYSSALSSVVYQNSKLANIIENQPDLTPRQGTWDQDK